MNCITSLLTNAYEASCPEMKAIRKKDGKLWSADIEKLRHSARKAWNKATRTRDDSDWTNFL